MTSCLSNGRDAILPVRSRLDEGGWGEGSWAGRPKDGEGVGDPRPREGSAYARTVLGCVVMRNTCDADVWLSHAFLRWVLPPCDLATLYFADLDMKTRCCGTELTLMYRADSDACRGQVCTHTVRANAAEKASKAAHAAPPVEVYDNSTPPELNPMT